MLAYYDINCLNVWKQDNLILLFLDYKEMHFLMGKMTMTALT